MADDNPNRPRTLGGDNASDPVTSSWPRPAASSAPRIGRIGGWGGGGSTYVSYHITIFITLTPNTYIPYVCSGGGGGGGGRRIATLGDDSDDGDDEPQNYFAGGERR